MSADDMSSVCGHAHMCVWEVDNVNTICVYHSLEDASMYKRELLSVSH